LAGAPHRPIRTTPNPSRTELGVLARYPGFTNAAEIAGRVVLWGCDAARHTTLRILDPDLLDGRDIATRTTCVSTTVVGDMLVIGGTALATSAVAVRIPSGAVEPYVAADGGPKLESAVRSEPTEAVLGATVYRGVRSSEDENGHYDSEDGVNDGIGAFDGATHRRIWRALWGDGSRPVTSEGTVVVRMVNALVELDPTTGQVLWERGVPGGGDIVPFTVDGADGFVITELLPSGHTELVLYRRGAAADAAWTGKIYGTVVDIGKNGHGRPYANLLVTAGSQRTKTDAHGKYELMLTTRGTVTVDTEVQLGSGSHPDRKLVEVAAGHGDYEVDLRVGYFDQACR